MARLLAIGLTAMAAVLLGDLLFRTSLLHTVRPVILEPTDGESVTLPVRLRWQGPQRMRIVLRYAGRERWDIGIHESPVDLPPEYFTDRGLYSVEIQSPTFGEWISSDRAFSVKNPSTSSDSDEGSDLGAQLGALQRSLQDLRASQEKTRDENTDLYEENAAIREENAILTEELNRLAEAERRATGRAAGLEREHADLVEVHRRLMEEAHRLRLRLTEVIPCTVWGYYSFPRPQTIPPTRQQVRVSSDQGEIFRTQDDCERFRHGDPTATSACFCVGNSWGG